MLDIPDTFGPDLRAALQAFIAKHAYSDAFAGRLGDGQGHVAVVSPDLPSLVYARRMDAVTPGDVMQVIQAPWLPVADSINGISLDGLPIMLSRVPEIHGGKNYYHVIGIGSTLATAYGNYAQNPTGPGAQNILYNTIAQSGTIGVQSSDCAQGVPAVKQLILPPSAFLGQGSSTGNAAIIFPGIAQSDGGGGGGGAPVVLPTSLNSYVEYKTTAGIAVTTTPTTANFDTFNMAWGSGAASQVVTGASWNFTAPVTNTYYIGVQFTASGGGINASAVVTLLSNGLTNTYAPLFTNPASGVGLVGQAFAVFMNAGDTLTIKLASIDAAHNATIPSGAIAEIGWVDAVASVQIYKILVQALATTNVNIASPGASIGGYSPSAGQRVMLTGQSTGSQNGPWIFNGASAALTRPVDYPSGNTVQAVYGLTFYVLNGTNGGQFWYCTTTGTITIDTTSTAWIELALTNSVDFGVILTDANGNVLSDANGNVLTT